MFKKLATFATTLLEIMQSYQPIAILLTSNAKMTQGFHTRLFQVIHVDMKIFLIKINIRSYRENLRKDEGKTIDDLFELKLQMKLKA